MSAPQAPSRPARRSAWRRWMLAGLAALTLVSALGVLLAPVTADDPVVTWPRAGEPARSTVLPLVPYRPLQLDATIPCATLAALDARGGGTALSTMPADVNVPQRPGLTVAAAGRTVTVAASGRDLLAEPLPAGGCTYRVVADAHGVRVLRDGSQLAAAPGLPAPQVAQLATDAHADADAMPAARGLAVTLHTDARYESSPTVLKTVLLAVHAAALLALLVQAWRTWRGSGLGLVRPRPGPADAVVLVVSALWVVLSPVNFDDPWYVLMARGATDSGAVGNAVYMFNVTENPFVASQYTLGVWSWLGQSLLTEGGWGLAWMRLLPLLYGLIVWLLLRFALVSGGASHGSHPHSPRWGVWALALAHMVWWLPYGMTLRPEPLIVVFAAAALLLAEVARRARSVGALAAATAAAALGVSVSPSGLVALAPLALALPWLWGWLRAARPADRVAATLTLVAAGTALIPVGFADATLGDVLESTAVHQWYYLTFAWYEEGVHYETLLSLPDSSQWARRAPVLLTLAVIALVALGQLASRYLGYRNGSGHGEPDGPVRRLMVRSAVMSAVALALLSLTPTKWVNHFGAVEAVPTVLLATALLQAPLAWPSRATLRSGRRTALLGLLPATAGTALLVWAVSVSFAGPNFWRPYSDRGQPFGDHLFAEITPSRVADMAPRIGWLFASNPAIWIGLALVFAAVMWWRGRGGLTPDGGLLRVSSVSIVVLTLLVFTCAPIRQYPGWTVPMSMIDAARGQPCGLAHHVRVLDDSDTAQPGQPVGAATRRGGFAATSGVPPPVPPPVPGSRVWHDAPVRGPSIGTLLTPWYPLPAGGNATHLLVPLLGDELERQQVWLQYGDGSGVTGAVPVRVDPEVAAGDWQEAPVPLDALGAHRPQQVRLAVEDQVAGQRQWIAVGEPRLARWRPVTAVTRDRPVYADQVSASLWPCVNQVSVEHGIAGAPAVTLLADENFRRSFLDIAFRIRQGGMQVPTDRTSAAVRVPARLAAPGPPTLPWGRVERVVYDHPVGLVDLRVDQQRRWGATRLPTLSGEDYNGYRSGTAPWNTTR
ncbi:MAG: arabinosyltransferase [Pseudonocardiaceae bacterium]|nr:arabinosyltransferase [Pseudonocardiaceae bacterium]